MSNVTENEYLCRLEVVGIGATDGSETYESVKKNFMSESCCNPYPDFIRYGIVFSGVAPGADIAVDELVKDGTFRDFLGSTPEELECRRMLGSQFVKLCREHPDKLSQERGHPAFVVLTENDESVVSDLSNVFIVFVDVRFGNLCLFVSGLNYLPTWYAEDHHRILYLKQ